MKNKNVLFVILFMIFIITFYNSFSKNNYSIDSFSSGGNSLRKSTSLERALNLGAYNLYGYGEGTYSEPYYYYPYEQYPLVLDQQF